MDTIQALFQYLSQCWDNGMFSANLSAIKSNSIDTLSQQLLKKTTLALQNASKPVLQNSNSIQQVVISEADYPDSFMGLTTPKAILHFWIDDQKEAQMKMRLTGNNTAFKLSEAFPVLSTYQADDFAFSEPSFTLQSGITVNKNYTKLQDQYADLFYGPEYDAQIITGLQFSGTLALPKELQWLEQILPFKAPSIIISGAVEILENSPRFTLSTTVYEGIHIGYMEMDIAFQLISLFCVQKSASGDGNTFFPTTFFRFETIYQYQHDSTKISIPVSCIFYDFTPDSLVFEIDGADGSSFALEKFAGILNTSDLSSWLIKLPGFPATDAMLLSALKITVDLSGKPSLSAVEMTLGFHASSGDDTANYPIIAGIFTIHTFQLDFGVTQPLSKSRTWYANISGQLGVENSAVEGAIYASLSLPNPRFSAGLTDYSTVDLTTLLNDLFQASHIPALPIPKVYCENFQVSGTKNPEAFNLATSLDLSQTINIGWFTLEEIGIALGYTGGGIKGSTVLLNAQMQITENYQMTLEAGLQDGGWLFEGSFNAKKEHPLTLQDFLPSGIDIPGDFLNISITSAAVSLNTGKESLSFTLQGDMNISFGEAGSVSGTSIQVDISKNGKDYDWTVTASGAIQLLKLDWNGNGSEKPLIDLKGQLKITNTPDISIAFIADKTNGGNVISNIPILIPYKVSGSGIEWSLMDFAFDTISLGKDKATKAWYFNADFNLTFTRIIKQLAAIIPKSGIAVALSIDGDKATIKLKNDFLEIPIPDITIPKIPDTGVGPLELGAAELALANLSLTIDKQISVGCDLKFFLPSKLNDLFGTDKQGNPKITPFYTYPDKDRSLDIHFTATASGPSIKAAIGDLPLHADFLKPAKDGKWEFILGDDGEYLDIGFTLPVLGFDTNEGGFTADIDFTVLKDPAIPLGMLKDLLDIGEMTSWSKLLPDKATIPYLNPPEFIVNGQLDVNTINKFFDNKLPQDVLNALDSIKDQVDKLPTDLLDYLNLELPKTLKLYLNVTGSGNVTIQFSADPGIKLLIPSLPSILGLQLRSFSFGELFDGILFSTSIDADFDDFDIVSLIAAALFSGDKSVEKYIGNPKNYHSRLELHNLLIIIFYELEIPIPIPVFYDKVGISYYGLGDMTLEASASFPEPKLNLMEATEFFTDLVKFFTDKTYKLDPHKQYKDFNIQFSLGPTYFQVPGWIGGKQLGLVHGFKPPSVYELIAYLLDGIKFFDLNDLVSTVPVDKRSGNGQLISNFICVESVSGGFLISTPPNFIGGEEYTHLGVNAAEANALLQMLPGTIQPTEKGMLIFLVGKWSSGMGSLDFNFGLAAIDFKQFDTAFNFAGKIGNMYDANLQAAIGIAASDTPFRANGKAKLEILGTNFFDGSVNITITSTGFDMSGSLTLLDSGYPFYFSGNVSGAIGKDALSLTGKVSAKLLIFSSGGSVTVGNTEISAGIFGSSFSIKVQNNTLSINGDLHVPLTVFTTTMSVNPSAGQASLKLKSSTINGLFGIEISGKGAVATLSSNLSFALELLGHSAFTGTASMQGDHFALNGQFGIGVGPFSLSGTLGGTLNDSSFNISGDITASADLGIHTFKGDGTITINNNGVSGTIKLKAGCITATATISIDDGCLKIDVGHLGSFKLC